MTAVPSVFVDIFRADRAHLQGASLVKIQVNGETREVPAEFTVADLLVELALQPKYLAVERNLILIPREEHAACALQEGDRLEIVTLVGGG